MLVRRVFCKGCHFLQERPFATRQRIYYLCAQKDNSMDHLSRKALTILGTSLCIGLPAQERPNIIVFLVDDMGLMDTSVPFITDSRNNPVRQPLNDWYRTPHMEQLAEQGIRFTTFYAQSVSSPSRASLMTGQNAARHRTTNWINSESDNRTPFGPPDWNWRGLTAADSIYPAVMRRMGYKTIHVGKAHFGCLHSEGEDPTRLGFDVNIAGSSIGEPGSYYGEEGYGWIKGTRSRAVPGLQAYHRTHTFLTDALTLEAMKEVKKAVDAGKPFYLNLAHYAVHNPFEVDPRFISHYPEGEKNPQARAFATLIEGMDKSLGDVLQALEKLGVAENTLIFFLGDNGGDAPLGGAADYGSSAPLKGKKGSEYEGGVRVPFIASWAKPDPENRFQKALPIAQGTIQPQMATIMDLYPTILAAAGVQQPAHHVTDGADLKRMLQGKTDRKHRDDFLMHFPHEHRGSYFTTYRKGDWKLIYYYHPENGGTPSYKLFNLARDPYEKNDLAASDMRRVKKMCRLMIHRLKKEKALYPVDKEGRAIYPRLPGK